MIKYRRGSLHRGRAGGVLKIPGPSPLSEKRMLFLQRVLLRIISFMDGLGHVNSCLHLGKAHRHLLRCVPTCGDESKASLDGLRCHIGPVFMDGGKDFVGDPSFEGLSFGLVRSKDEGI